MKNIENCKLVLDQIEKHPETWNQGWWHCGSTHCFAGWAQLLSGKKANHTTVRTDARIFLGLNRNEANYYFSNSRTLSELKTVLDDSYGGYDRDGYDRDGYDRSGYDRSGYDRDGYDRDGYDRSGYDRSGYDRDKLDKNNKPKL